MSKDFKDLDSLLNYLQTDVLPEALGDAEDVVKNTMSQAVHREVYNSYDPLVYERRINNGGLSDTDNMRSYFITSGVNQVTMVTENYTTGENGYELDGLIAYGHNNGYGSYEYPYNRYGTQDEFLQPRNFYYETVNMLEDSLDHIQAMKRGFKRLGIRTD